MTRASFAVWVLLVLGVPTLQAELINPSPTRLITPTLEILEQPRHAYTIDDTIYYRIELAWQGIEAESLRMSPPSLDLENLKLLGVRQASETQLDSAADARPRKRILEFSFRALEPGPARLNRIELEWRQNSSRESSKVQVPGFALNIRKQIPWRLIFYSGAGIATLSFIGFALYAYRKSRALLQTVEPPPPDESQKTINHLVQLHLEWKRGGNTQLFLSRLTQLSEDFLSREFNWQPSQESYNALLERVQKRWGRHEVNFLDSFRKRLEYYRYSGLILENNQVENIYQGFESIVRRKQVIAKE